MLSDEKFYYTQSKDGYILGDQNNSKPKGLKNRELLNCVIPKTFNGKIVFGLGYQCFHSAHSLIKAFVPNTISLFHNDVFANCSHLEEILFEDGFKNVNLAGYTLYRTIMRSFKFPIGSTAEIYFFQWSNIKNVYIYDYMHSNDSSIFSMCPQTINIFVPANYPYDTFAQRSVTKILPDYYYRAESKRIIITCANNHLSYVIPFIFLFA